MTTAVASAACAGRGGAKTAARPAASRSRRVGRAAVGGGAAVRAGGGGRGRCSMMWDERSVCVCVRAQEPPNQRKSKRKWGVLVRVCFFFFSVGPSTTHSLVISSAQMARALLLVLAAAAAAAATLPPPTHRVSLASAGLTRTRVCRQHAALTARHSAAPKPGPAGDAVELDDFMDAQVRVREMRVSCCALLTGGFKRRGGGRVFSSCPLFLPNP